MPFEKILKLKICRRKTYSYVTLMCSQMSVFQFPFLATSQRNGGCRRHPHRRERLMEIGKRSHVRNWHKNYNDDLTDQFPYLIRPELLGNKLLFQTQNIWFLTPYNRAAYLWQWEHILTTIGATNNLTELLCIIKIKKLWYDFSHQISISIAFMTLPFNSKNNGFNLCSGLGLMYTFLWY